MNKIESFFDENIELVDLDIKQKIEEFKISPDHPIIEFNKILMDIKHASTNSKNVNDEINAMTMFQTKLNNFSKKFNMKNNHFKINTSGPTIVVKDVMGQHYIAPTHFEKGAYFSSPHYDHELNFTVEQIPQIHIGQYTRFGKNSAVNAGANIFIGDFVWLAPGSTLLRQEHNAYGQPSIGARTVSMTKQPAIYVSDYAWVGRDAIVGWGSEYIGKCSIVGARSFINKWVGDYSIVGDHSRILGYLPYKAYFMAYYQPTLKNVLRISSWDRIYDEWKIYYEKNKSLYNQIFLPETSQSNVVGQKLKSKGKVLIINPKSANLFNSFPKNTTLDIFSRNEKLIPFILQEASNMKMTNIRVRHISKGNQLFLPQNKKSMMKETGYDIIITPSNEDFIKNKRNIIAALNSNGFLMCENVSEESKDEYTIIQYSEVR